MKHPHPLQAGGEIGSEIEPLLCSAVLLSLGWDEFYRTVLWWGQIRASCHTHPVHLSPTDKHFMLRRLTFPWSLHQSYQTVWGQNGGQKRFFNALVELMVTRKEIQRRPLIRWSLIYKNYNMNTFEEIKLIIISKRNMCSGIMIWQPRGLC